MIAGILMCTLLTALDQTVVLPAIPQMAATLSGGGQLSWVVSAYLLTNTATTPIYGKLSDQMGRRAVLAPALVFFILASVLCALADSVPMLIAGRALQGLGGGALMAVAQSAVADVIPPRERGRYQAFFAGTWAFSSIAGPIAGGFITQHLSWRYIFWANLPLGLLALGLSWRGLAGLVPTGARGRIDYAGAALVLFSVGALLLALSAGGVDFPWVSAPEAGIFAAGAVGLAVLVWQQRRATAPLLPGALLARPAYRDVLLVSGLNSAALIGAVFLLPLLLQWLYRQSPSAAGLDVVPLLFTTTIGAFAAGQVTRRTGGVRPVILAGLVVAGVAFALLAAAPGAGGLVYPVGVSGLAGLGMGCLMPSTLIAAQSQAARGDVGAATGTLLLARALGGAFGATMAGAFLAIARENLVHGFRQGFFACAVVQAVAALLAWRMQDVQLRNTVEAG